MIYKTKSFLSEYTNTLFVGLDPFLLCLMILEIAIVETYDQNFLVVKSEKKGSSIKGMLFYTRYYAYIGSTGPLKYNATRTVL